MNEDLRTFAVAFSLVWVALAVYLLYLHRLQSSLAGRIEAIERREGKP